METNESNKTNKRKSSQQNLHFTFRLSFISMFSSWTNLKRIFNKQHRMITKYYSSVQWRCILENCVLSCTKTKLHQVKEYLGFNAITYHGWKVQSMEEQAVVWMDLLQQIYTQAPWFQKISERDIRNCIHRVLNRKSTNTDVLE